MSFTCNSSKYIIVPINKIIIDEEIINFLEGEQIIIPEKYINNIQDCGTYKLAGGDRWKSIKKGYETGLPAISVRIKSCESDNFKVLNGRHRIALSIYKNLDFIPVIIDHSIF
jgi:hypothetical protein